MLEPAPPKHTNGARLIKNSFWNFLGLSAPLLAAVVAIPVLIDNLGTACFGILTLAWMVVGYFSLFDFGMSRAMTHLLAQKLSRNEHDDISPLFWTALATMCLLGVTGGILVALLTPWLVTDVLTVPPELAGETLTTSYLLALSIPLVVVSTGARGALEAYQYFGLVNAVRLPTGIFNFVGPLLVLPFTNTLPAVVGVLLLTRLFATTAYLHFCLNRLAGVGRAIDIRWSYLHPLLSFGGWMTVTNVLGPLLTYLDRFVIAATVSVTAVAYYATPHEMVTRLGIIPTALLGALFPAFSGILVKQRDSIGHYYWRASLALMLIMLPLTLFLTLFAAQILQVWINAEFRAQSTAVMQVFLLGIYLNCFARVASTLVQSDGRPDISAKLHLLEIVPFVAALWFAATAYGVLGAAWVWAGRIALDLALLTTVIRYRGMTAGADLRRLLTIVALTTASLAGAALLQDPLIKMAYGILCVAALYTIVWRQFFSAEDRIVLKKQFTALRGGEAR